MSIYNQKAAKAANTYISLSISLCVCVYQNVVFSFKLNEPNRMHKQMAATYG